MSESFSATTANGDIKVDFAEAAPGTVDVDRRTGDVVLGLPGQGRYIVDAS